MYLRAVFHLLFLFNNATNHAVPLVPHPAPQPYGASPHAFPQKHGGVPNSSPNPYGTLPAHPDGTSTPLFSSSSHTLQVQSTRPNPPDSVGYHSTGSVKSGETLHLLTQSSRCSSHSKSPRLTPSPSGQYKLTPTLPVFSPAHDAGNYSLSPPDYSALLYRSSPKPLLPPPPPLHILTHTSAEGASRAHSPDTEATPILSHESSAHPSPSSAQYIYQELQDLIKAVTPAKKKGVLFQLIK